jgi:hypothetical protein
MKILQKPLDISGIPVDIADYQITEITHPQMSPLFLIKITWKRHETS